MLFDSSRWLASIVSWEGQSSFILWAGWQLFKLGWTYERWLGWRLFKLDQCSLTRSKLITPWPITSSNLKFFKPGWKLISILRVGNDMQTSLYAWLTSSSTCISGIFPAFTCLHHHLILLLVCPKCFNNCIHNYKGIFIHHFFFSFKGIACFVF